MKNVIFVLAALLIGLSSCKKEEKEEESATLTKEELLCQTWTIDTYSLNGSSFAWLPRLYHWKFKTDGSIDWYKIETGEFYKTTHWAWAEDKEALDIEEEISNGFTTVPIMVRTNVLRLTKTEMILEPGNSEHELEMKFSR